tara:strand:- start:4222 stop:4338 length:117 start_codon:yes stop_codon:yes gene_type:complete
MLKKLDIKANILDLCNVMNDKQLKEKGYYNYDLDDFIN